MSDESNVHPDDRLEIKTVEHRINSLRVIEIVLSGPLNSTTYQEFKDVIDDCIDEGKSLLMLNFEHLLMFDEAGSGGIISSKTKCKKDGGEMVIVRPNKQIKTLLGLIRFDKIMPVFDTLEDGLHHFTRIPLG